VILGRHGEPLFIDCVRNTLGDGPGFQDVVHFQPEIVMQVTGLVFLDYEPATASLPARPRNDGHRFDCFGEVALLAVGLKPARRGLLVATQFLPERQHERKKIAHLL
jgi:hypothetical protein